MSAIAPSGVSLVDGASAAQRAVDALARVNGPIVIVVKGTNNRPVDNANRATLDLLRRTWDDEPSVVAIEYPASFPPLPDSVPRGTDALRRLLDALRGRTGRRPIYLLAESQGAWVAREVLADPRYASLVTRMVAFAEPAVGSLHSDAAIGARKLSIRHVDDAITATPPDLSLLLDPQFLGMCWTLLTSGRFSYDPHDYRADAAVAARFLVTGQRPSPTQAVHQHVAHGS